MEQRQIEIAPEGPRLKRQSTALYRKIITAIRCRVDDLDLPLWRVDELSGLQDGYTAKAMKPDTPSGRQAGWPMLQMLLDALYPEGFEVLIVPCVPSNAQQWSRLEEQKRGYHRNNTPRLLEPVPPPLRVISTANA